MRFHCPKTDLELREKYAHYSQTHLKNSQQRYNEQIRTVNEALASTVEKLAGLNTLLLESETDLKNLIAQEPRIKSDLKDALEDLSIDNCIIRANLLAFSPLQLYKNQVAEDNGKLLRLKNEISLLKSHMGLLERELTACYGALRVIDGLIHQSYPSKQTPSCS